MQVLILNTSEKKGGAAVAASRLTEALINNGVKARMMVMEKQSSALYVSERGGGWRGEWHFLWERVCIWMRNLLSRRNLFAVSIANTGTDITQTPEFREADVVHLHWVNQGFLSLRSVHRILQSGKPVVWTMHDMWPMTGICHHSGECARYESSCHDCPLLRRPGAGDLSARTFRRKQQLLSGQHVQFVAVSQWLAGRARRSALLQGQTVSVIPNAMALGHFTPIDRLDARSALDIHERYVLVFGAARIDDPIKGFTYLLQALHVLVSSGRYRAEELRLLLFGGIKDEAVLATIPIPYIYMGYVNDEHRLAQVYSAANCVVSSSLYETFGQTLVEALSCGCLPVSFDGSGQTDIIDHLKNGYLAQRLSAESLADGLDWAFQTVRPVRELRSGVLRRFSPNVVANKYIQLYNSISHTQA